MYPSGEFSQELSERLVSGEATQPARLAALLAAAARPGTPRELAGEDTAVLAFREARSAPAPRRVGRPAAARALGGRLGVRVALLAAAAVVAGLGLATVTGVIPDVTGLVPSGNSSANLDTSAGQPTSGRAASTGADPSGSTGAAQASTDPAPDGLPGLCRAYRSHPANERSKQLEKPAFARLVTAAGSREAVPAYCDGLIGPEETSTTTPKPTRTHGRPGSAA